MSKFKPLITTATGSLRLVAFLAAALFLSACSDDDSKVTLTEGQIGNGAMFHGAEWATIKDLDPRGEQCVDCHGLNNDMSPYNAGFMAHNIGLQKNTDHSAYANLKITGVKVNETSGEVTVTLNQALPANAGNLSMTFAKLAPRVIHNRGHDWQNYFSSNATGRGGNEPKASFMPNGGVQPQAVPSPKVDGKTITFNLGTGREFGTLDNFTVESAYEGDNLSWNYSGIKGTKIKMGDDLATHVYCDAAHANSNQTPATSTTATDLKAVCWWPDGTHLTAGTFVTTNNEFVVEYNPDQTHRVTIILGSTAGNPGFNTWYDFVPSVANGAKTPSDFTSTDTTLTGSDYISPITGQVISDNYKVAEGRKAPGGIASDNDTEGHQSLPAARDVVDVQSCNSCHDGLTMHGGSGRSQTQTCVTCHNPGNLQASSGRSVDFKQLIHRVHRGVNLPSEDPSLANLMQDGNTLLAKDVDGKLSAGDFTKVRFPQGPRPGDADGIMNCVKCHMGEQTKAMVQGLATQLGAGDSTVFNVQEKLKLAKVTPQGDNWLSVRSVNACQACHDSNVWFASDNGNTVGTNTINNKLNETGTTNPTDQLSANQLDKYMPFYAAKYSGVGFDWLGKKLSRNNDAGWIHNTGSPDGSKGRNDRFTCGSSGGCHGNTAIDLITTALGNGNNQVGTVGNRSSNSIQQVHLKLTRDHIIAERFSVEFVQEPTIDANGNLEAVISLLDRGNVINAIETPDPTSANPNRTKIETSVDLNGSGAVNVTVGVTSRIGWMLNSPDYNHSAGNGIPGNPVNVTAAVDGVNIKLTADLSTARDGKEWEKIQQDLTKVVGSLFVGVTVDSYAMKSEIKDFRFDGDLEDGGRRMVVDFTAGNGIDENRDRYAGWDKEHGANTQSCSSCHLRLPYHAGVSNNVQGCIMCHNAQRTDLNSRGRTAVNGLIPPGEDGQYEESLDFKRLVHAIHSAPNKRIDPFYVGTNGNARPSIDKEGDVLANTVRGNSFPGVISNCKSCHIKDADSGLWTFDLQQLPKGMIGSTAITGDWANEVYSGTGSQHDFDNHKKMSPIASVCSSCHDAGYKTSDGRMNENNAPEGGPYVGSHWWQMGGIAPGIVAPGADPQSTIHQSGK